MQTTTPYDLAVIGGGIAGLIAANRAARAGLRVIVLERSDDVGGRASTDTVGDALLNRGPHALARRGHAAQTLTAMGIRLEGGPAATRGRLIGADSDIALPDNPAALLAHRQLSLRDKVALTRWFLSIGRADPKTFADTTVACWLDATVPTPRARAIAQAFIRLATYAHAPQSASADMVIRRLQVTAVGVLYLDGGWQALVAQLVERLVANGGTLRTRAPIRALKCGEAIPRAVTSDGTTIAATTIIVATSPAGVAKMMPENGRLRALSQDARPVRAACLDLVLDRLAGNEGFRFGLGVDAPTYLALHSDIANLSTGGRHVLHVARYLGEDDAPSQVRDELEAVMDRAQPGWRDHVVDARFLPRITVNHWLPTATNGGLAGRPTLAATGVEGVILAGDWIGGDGWLVDASAASAVKAADVAIARARRAAAPAA